MYLLLYADDMLIASNSMAGILEVKKLLASKFETKDLGEAKVILGMQINRQRKLSQIDLHQSSYLNKVMLRFNILCSKLVTGQTGIKVVFTTRGKNNLRVI